MATTSANLSSVIEIVELIARHSEAEINQKLESEKWILLAVATGVDFDGFPITMYSLGRVMRDDDDIPF